MTPEELSRDHVNVAHLLGVVLLENHEWQRAHEVLQRARETFALLFAEGLDEMEARDLIDIAGSLFVNAAYAACEMGDVAAAFEIVSEGRARLLKIALQSLELELPPDIMERIGDLRREIHETTARLERTTVEGRSEFLDQLVRARQDLARLLESHDAPAEGSPLNAGEMARRLVPEGGAIVVPIVTAAGGKLLVVAGDDNFAVTVRDMPKLTTGKLATFLAGAERFVELGGWLGAYAIQYLPREERQPRIGEWFQAIHRLGEQLWDIIGRYVREELARRAIQPGARVIWLPTGPLGLLPLGLARDGASGEPFAQSFEITYAPALDVLHSAQERMQALTAVSLAAAVNPTGDLTYTELEAHYVAAHFTRPDTTILARSEATPAAVLAALRDRSYWHFACHGEFDWQDARRSGLIMARRQRLTVNELQQPGGPRHPRLVVLSACETGLYEFHQNPDEFTGLPSAFMALGAAGIVSTLWRVDDRATALMIARFYDLHRSQGLSPPTALKLAQAWLRGARRSELYAETAGAAFGDRGLLDSLRRYLGVSAPVGAQLGWLSRTTQGLADVIDRLRRREPPFAHPYYWGAFIYTGL